MCSSPVYRNMQYGPDLNSVLQHELFVMTDRPALAVKKIKNKKNMGGGGVNVPA